ncbi:DUF5994 family protein [Amycolatopsis sp. NPDC005232]|uniref:DUF5994 family protein n=1 Tax=Amycolatopsis sp. NPDC005232 TaxID=3157027 RepID=UPI0033BC7CD8
MRLKPAGPTTGHVDGEWWPRSRDLTCELPALLTAAVARLGRIGEVAYHAEKNTRAEGTGSRHCPPEPRYPSWRSRKDPLINISTLDNPLFSHPIAEQPRPGALTTSQDDRYGKLFLQPGYEPGSDTETETRPHRRPGNANTRVRKSGRPSHR